MKILIVSQYYKPEPFRISDIAETMLSDGHEVTVLTSQPNYPQGKIYHGFKNKYSEVYDGDLRLIRTKIFPRKKGKLNLFLNYISFPIYSRKFVNTVHQDYDIIFIYQLSPILMALPAIKLSNKLNIPTVLYCLDLWPESLISGSVRRESITYKIVGKISNRIYRSVDKVLISSKQFFDKFDKIGIKQVEYLPQYAETLFENISNVNNGVFDIVFAGNVGEMQDIITLVDTANMLKDNNYIYFHIVGDGSKMKECIQLCNEYKLSNIKFYGRRPLQEMRKFYALADCMIVLLKDDLMINNTLPGKVQSYMAAGKPFIAAANGETKKVVEQADCGYVSKPSNSLELRNTIVRASKDKLINVKGQNALTYYKKHFHKKIFFRKLYRIMEEIRNV